MTAHKEYFGGGSFRKATAKIDFRDIHVGRVFLKFRAPSFFAKEQHVWALVDEQGLHGCVRRAVRATIFRALGRAVIPERLRGACNGRRRL